jgi:zinc transport system permease protein
MNEFLSSSAFLPALLAGLSLALVAPVLGMFLTVKRQSLISDALAHASLAGVAIAALIHTDAVLVAVIVAVLAALVVEYLRTTGTIGGDAALSVAMSGGLAVAAVLLSLAGDMDAEVLELLFGDITDITMQGLWVTVGVTSTVLAFFLPTFPQQFLIAFDEDIARAQGIRVNGYNVLLAVSTAAIAAVGMRIIGVLLMGALMIIPVIAATQFGLGFRRTTALAVMIALLSVGLGLFGASVFHLAAGGSVVIVAISFFLIGLLYRRFH